MDGDAVNTLDPWFKRFCTKSKTNEWATVTLNTNCYMPENCSLVFTSSAKREKRAFLNVGVQRRLRNVQKCVIFCQSKPINFLPSSLLKFPNLSNVKDGKTSQWGSDKHKEVLLLPPKGDVSRLPLPKIIGWKTNTHYKLKKGNIATPPPPWRACESIASARNHRLKYKYTLQSKSWNTEYLSVGGCW